jgi:UDP-N-acetylglucosamine diphosphorylase / glucose-1-phosphate thymidylyltransferase / UDP-N-acetylgalactosamine diphosphorylase / glucosamine-1-phosphate N-acetyltransferase / galactosamine-1-phosphate N-acetyltransferase
LIGLNLIKRYSSDNMKALILAGGRGSRLNQLSSHSSKCMIEVSGKPIIEYSISIASKLDIKQIIIVVGYYSEQIIEYFGMEYQGMKIKYVLQEQQNGLVHAIECAKPELGDSDFMLFLGDEILVKSRHHEMLDKYRKGGVFCICGVVRVENREEIRKTYGVILSENKVCRLIEKPNKPHNDYMGTGNCVFNNKILDFIDLTPINQKRNQKELPDLIQCAVDEGYEVEIFSICDLYSNINNQDNINEIDQYLESRLM